MNVAEEFKTAQAELKKHNKAFLDLTTQEGKLDEVPQVVPPQVVPVLVPASSSQDPGSADLPLPLSPAAPTVADVDIPALDDNAQDSNGAPRPLGRVRSEVERLEEQQVKRSRTEETENVPGPDNEEVETLISMVDMVHTSGNAEAARAHDVMLADSRKEITEKTRPDLAQEIIAAKQAEWQTVDAENMQ